MDADTVDAGSLSGDYVYVNGSSIASNCIKSLGPASASGGTITIPVTMLNGSAGTSVTFNIADTQFYQDAVSAAEASGIAEGESHFALATVTLQGASETVYTEDTSGTWYYTAGSAVYSRGSSVQRVTTGYLYDANGNPVGYGGWFRVDNLNINYLYQSGDQVTPINPNGLKRLKSVTRYQAGTTDSTTYYTKTV